jgi:serine/threonine protein kinase
LIGRTLDRYRIEAKLGEGGMGVVYRARDTHLDRLVAIKVLPRDKVSDPARKQRFAQEARAASALNHRHIITVHDICVDSGADFIVMEYATGGTLDQIVQSKRRRSEIASVILKCRHAAAHWHDVDNDKRHSVPESSRRGSNIGSPGHEPAAANLAA